MTPPQSRGMSGGRVVLDSEGKGTFHSVCVLIEILQIVQCYDVPKIVPFIIRVVVHKIL